MYLTRNIGPSRHILQVHLPIYLLSLYYYKDLHVRDLIDKESA